MAQEKWFSPYSAYLGGDFYKLLGVDRAASKNQIRKAFSRLLQDTHTDSLGATGLSAAQIDPLITEAFNTYLKELTYAFEILNDDGTRQYYDLNKNWLDAEMDQNRQRQEEQAIKNEADLIEARRRRGLLIEAYERHKGDRDKLTYEIRKISEQIRGLSDTEKNLGKEILLRKQMADLSSQRDECDREVIELNETFARDTREKRKAEEEPADTGKDGSTEGKPSGDTDDSTKQDTGDTGTPGGGWFYDEQFPYDGAAGGDKDSTSDGSATGSGTWGSGQNFRFKTGPGSSGQGRQKKSSRQERHRQENERKNAQKEREKREKAEQEEKRERERVRQEAEEAEQRQQREQQESQRRLADEAALQTSAREAEDSRVAAAERRRERFGFEPLNPNEGDGTNDAPKEGVPAGVGTGAGESKG